MDSCKIGKDIKGMVLSMALQSGLVGSGKVNFGSNSGLLDVINLDLERGFGNL